ncbi:branched-chain amino acid ABC transporter permease [Nocardioides terrisoli]|uniref:branched-chain amino acid ABC transporter permease n=1 Tax=Nocardioides terrisoli TaxID=3388267 RepID=UPI00287BBF8B|nr:branched-chain amino acid ABC transporter permease [Nocardioides marmorisolisilvae]
MATFLQYTVNGLTVGSFFALVALGYTIVFGILRMINFAQGDLSMVGAFLGYTALVTLGAAGMPVVLALVVTLAVSMVGTVAVNLVILEAAYRPMLRRKSALGIVITALGMALLLENGVRLLYGPIPKAYPPVLPDKTFHLGGVVLSYQQIVLVLVSAILMVGLLWFANKTTTGTAMRALSSDHDAARLMGVNVDWMIRLAFVFSAVLASASGIMLALYYAQIDFMMGFLLGLKAFTAAVIGGIGNIPGAVLGGLLIGLLSSYFSAYVSGRWTDALVFGALVLTLVIRPTGLLGERVVERV